MEQKFTITILAMSEIFISILIGFLSVRTKLLRAELIDNLSELVIYITLPLMIFISIVNKFEVSLIRYLWIFPLISLVMSILGFFFAEIAIKVIKLKENNREFKVLISFQNSGYLPLALAYNLLTEENAKLVILYIIFFLIGFNFTLWSWGAYLFRDKDKKGAKELFLFRLFSPPFISALIGLFFALTGINKFLPHYFLKPLKALGDCTVPLGLFIVGASLAGLDFNIKMAKGIFEVILIKLLVMPSFFFIILYFLKVPYLISLTVLLEAMMPSATSLSILSNVYGGNRDYISKGIFLTHLFSLTTIPLFLFLFDVIF